MWPSSEGCERVSIAEAMASDDMPGIPALPVSGRDGEEILQLIGGDVAPEDWQGGEGAPVYRLGPGPAVLNLTYTVSFCGDEICFCYLWFNFLTTVIPSSVFLCIGE
jgi:hypothetical protein